MKAKLTRQLLQCTKSFFGYKKDKRLCAQLLYKNIVAHSRQEIFYKDYGVPDTIDGRFELIVFHAFLVIDRLKRNKSLESRQLSQELFDEMFMNFDINLREMGVGDMGIGKKIKHMLKSFYGRAEAYDSAFQKGEKALEDCFVRNLYGTVQFVELPKVYKMISYASSQMHHLNNVSERKMLSGDIELYKP